MATSSSLERVPPPPYAAQEDQVNDTVRGTQHLQLKDLDKATSAGLTVDKVLVHLKLLHAIYTLPQFVSKEDGLFGFFNEDVTSVTRDSKFDGPESKEELEEELLSRLMVKRWAVYVTRAVRRFERWWDALKDRHGVGNLLSKDMKHANFETSVRRTPGSVERSPVKRKADLPPLDILMVWHNDMPWEAFNKSIDAQTERYNPTEAKEQFEALTGLNWSNLDDSDTTVLGCPSSTCQGTLSVSFTAASRASVVEWTRRSTQGNISEFPRWSGYADTDFCATCSTCGIEFGHERLRAAKFSRDWTQLWAEGEQQLTSKPMAGTVLDSEGAVRRVSSEQDFPNRLLRAIIQRGSYPTNCTSMDDVRREIEIAIQDWETMKIANKSHPSWMAQKSQIRIRRMMSRYWDNSSPFALDLVGAVVRQGAFIEKMENLDWLHSPTASSTASRLILKCERFFYILAMNPDKPAVPTLDVDLAWHTYQLAPSLYYTFSYTRCGERLIDHDNKITETKLNDAFIETSSSYQKLYKEPYSECICWYCESVRACALSGVSSLFNRSKYEEIENHLNDPKNPRRPTSDPQSGPHISVHNAISPETEASSYQAELSRTLAGLSEAYQTACKRAKKSGRPIPPEPPMLKASRARYNGGNSESAAMIYYPFMMPTEVGIFGCYGVYPTNPGCANLIAGNCVSCTFGGEVALEGRR